MTSSPFPPGLLAMLLACLLTGCGVQGPAKYFVSGEVTYNGAPIPIGEISFEPDTSQGNDGPGSTAVIKDGKFQTESDGGVVGGPYVVWISGFDGKPVLGGDTLTGRPLFNHQHKVTIDLPKEVSTQNFDVPASIK